MSECRAAEAGQGIVNDGRVSGEHGGEAAVAVAVVHMVADTEIDDTIEIDHYHHLHLEVVIDRAAAEANRQSDQNVQRQRIEIFHF